MSLQGIVNFKFKDYNAAVDDLSRCIKRAKKNKSAYTYLGLALSAIGEYEEAEEAHLKSLHLDQCFLDAWAHLAQFYLDLANSEKALHCLEKVLLVNGRCSSGLLKHITYVVYFTMGWGNIGNVKDYDAVLDLEHDSMDKFVLQCLAFYQASHICYFSYYFLFFFL
ncbi:hypothetical protein BHE74_00013836 [Ensete ventricosum]|nr:hypothetical protein GW17_00035484 [Ensete ventricosum]RWW77965.1 hypothetical protein BHE74_00013836 [Ensete ventricosum]